MNKEEVLTISHTVDNLDILKKYYFAVIVHKGNTQSNISTEITTTPIVTVKTNGKL